MIPLHDNIRSQTTPWVNYTIIGLCTLIFLQQLVTPGALVEELGMVPRRLLSGGERIMVRDLGEVLGLSIPVMRPLADSWLPDLLTPLSCIFLHGGWLHFLGNMWFLFIFGDNVEDRLGHGRYLGFYLATGLLASLTHLATNASSTVPTIGASGAIAGAMGAYLLLYPQARVLTLVPIFIVIQILVVPAALFLGVWFLLQLFQGAMSLGGSQAGGVAWWAHIGGFAAGWVLARFWRERQRLRSQSTETRGAPGRIPTYHLSRRPRRWQ